MAALEARIAELSALMDVLDHERLRCLRRFDELGGWADQGARSCAHWLSWRTGLSPGAAREQVRVARALASLPLMDAALARGNVSYSKVRAMTRTATPENEAAFLDMARSTTAGQIEVLSRKYQEVVDPTSPSAARFFRRTDLESGMVRLVVQVRPEEAAVVMKALDVAIRMARGAPGDVSAGTASSAAGDVSAGTCSRADALLSICESFLADGATRTTSVPGRYEVTVHVSGETLAGKSDEPCELEDGSRVSAETARRLACGAPIVEVVENRDGTEVVGRRRARRPSIALRRALEKRDKTCRFPGCPCRLWVDVHHVQPWSQDGETKLDNLVQLCKRHHVLVHEGGFRVEREGDGFRFFDRWGSSIPAVPEALDVPDGSIAQLARDHPEVDDRTNFPLWDGSRLDHGACVDAILAAGATPPSAADLERLRSLYADDWPTAAG